MKLIFLLFLILIIGVNGHDNHTIAIFKCDSPTESCSNRGFCSIDNSQCECFEPYTTFECLETVQCCYRRRTQSTAMVLHFLFGLIGGSMFYLRHVLHGTMLLLLSTGIFCIAPLIATFYDVDNNRKYFKIVYFVSLGTALIYWTIVVVLLSGCDFKDEHGIQMHCNF